MEVFSKGVAVIEHEHTGDRFYIDADQLDWEIEEVGGGPMGNQTMYSASIEHPNLGTLTWSIWEYPVGSENDRTTDIGGHLLIQDFDFGLEHTPEEQDERTSRINGIVEWFRSNYEDPAERTSYESREGGYLWNHGGPFDARDEIAGHFGDLPDDIIESAAEEIEREGIYEWAGGDWWDQLDADSWGADGQSDSDSWDSDGLQSLDRPLPDLTLDDPEEEPDEEAIKVPEQGPGPLFRVTDAGLLDVAPQGSVPPNERDAIASIRSVLLQATDQLISQLVGSNAFPALRTIAEQYRLAASTDPLSVDLLYALGVRLENATARIEADIKSGDLPPMSAGTGEALDSVLALHGPLILSTERGQLLIDLAHQYSRTEAEAETYRQAALGLTEAVHNATDLFTRNAAELIAAANQDVGVGPHPERSMQVAHASNRNLLIATSLSVAVLLGQTVVGTGFAESLPGLALSGAITQVTNAAWNFLVTNAPSLQNFVAASGMADMGWLRSLVNRVTAIGKI